MHPPQLLNMGAEPILAAFELRLVPPERERERLGTVNAATGEAEVVRTLLEAGARSNARTSVKIGWGKTALDLAKERGHRERVGHIQADLAALQMFLAHREDVVIARRPSLATLRRLHQAGVMWW